MASTTYFGRPEQEGRRLGADFDLIAKWSRSFHLRHPVHSYYLTQLSDNDRSKLFTGPAEEFRLEQGTDDNTVKLETVKDEVDRIDPDVQAMMRSSGYIRSEARRFEVLNAVEDAQDEAQGAAALALSKALMAGVDGPKAEKLAKEAADKTLSSAARKVKAHWKAAARDRFEHVPTETEPAITPSKPNPAEMRSPSPVGPDFVARWNATLRERFPALAARLASQEPAAVALKDVHNEKTNSAVVDTGVASSQSANTDDKQTTPQQKHAAKLSSPNVSVPEYGSETSTDSVQWNSPMYTTGELPSSPDVDSVVGFSDEMDGGVVLLPTSLVEELMLQDEPDVVTPKPAPATVNFSPPNLGSHLGAGLKEAFFVFPSGINAMDAGNPFHSAYSAALSSANADQFAAYANLKHTVIKPDTTLDGATKPFSPNSKNSKYPRAKEQPWMGFTCYDVDMKFGFDQLIPKYWTTMRGKERYLRHKIGELKLDDAKIRSDRFSGAVARNPIHVFVDLSNIIIGFYDSMKESRGIPVTKRVMAPMFSFKNFDTILTRDRNVAKRIVAGSMSNSYNKRWPSYMLQAQELLYEMNILERVPKPSSPVRKRRPKAGGTTREAETLTSGADTSGDDGFVGPMKNGEQGVDELLHLKILQSAMDTPSPATMVLATGDAASAQYSDGFKKNIERVLTLGWHIELYAWSRNISSAWRETGFAEQWGHQFKIVELDGFCEELFDMTVESLER